MCGINVAVIKTLGLFHLLDPFRLKVRIINKYHKLETINDLDSIVIMRKIIHQLNIVLYSFFSQNFGLLERNIRNNKPCKKVQCNYKYIHEPKVQKGVDWGWLKTFNGTL